jgi:hypothetical protein
VKSTKAPCVMKKRSGEFEFQWLFSRQGVVGRNRRSDIWRSPNGPAPNC